MEIKAADVMKLRKMTGAGMMDCKKALMEAEGDYERAKDIIREKGKLVVSKRADRSATEGVVVTKIEGGKAYLLCLACETDFVAQNEEFAGSANAILDIAVKNDAADKDTLLAKVDQIGAACHTGNSTCFFQPLVGIDYDEKNPLQIFEKVYATIADRKEHPKEGSYTNYLFEKGLDKILKKVGEEATEIVIAAKNKNPEEIKYEVADFLYHAMVLMVERGVSWEDIIKELADR